MLALTLVSSSVLLGGAWIETPEQVQQKNFFGLDWFILDLIIVGLLFIPLERYFSDPPFKVFRKHWKPDFLHFLFSHLLIQILSFMILWPSLRLAPLFAFESLQVWIQSQPKWLQFVEIILIADLSQYGIHRMFHKVPWMWRFHSIHHSSEQLDWLAGSRLHLFDIVLTRGLTLFPLYLIGFSQGALEAYLVFVAFWATFLHVRFHPDLSWLESFFASPRFHHWHHASDPRALDKNFAIHLPLLDRLFGSYYLPPGKDWPAEYGLSHEEISPTYWGQLIHPFIKNKKT